MKYRIAGFGGAHDEAGARIEDENGNYVLTTPPLKANTPEHWKAYYDNNHMVLNALNGHDKLKDYVQHKNVSCLERCTCGLSEALGEDPAGPKAKSESKTN